MEFYWFRSRYSFVCVVDSTWMHSKLKRFYCDFVLNRKNWDEHCSRNKTKRKEKKRKERGECIQRYQWPDSTVLYSFLHSQSLVLVLVCARRLNVVFSHEWLIDVCMCTVPSREKSVKKSQVFIWWHCGDGWRLLNTLYTTSKIEIQCSVEFHFDNIYRKWRHSFDIMTMQKSIPLCKHISSPISTRKKSSWNTLNIGWRASSFSLSLSILNKKHGNGKSMHAPNSN